MAILTEIYFKKETLETLVKTLTAKNENGVSVTVSVDDQIKEYTRPDGRIVQQNVGAYVSQSKEDREAKKDRFYVANGRQVWDNGEMPPSIKLFKESNTSDNSSPGTDDSDDLPF